MGITTIDEAKQAFTGLLAGGDGWLDIIRTLQIADAGVVIEAATALLVDEAAAVLGVKGWSLPDALRATSKAGGFRGSSRSSIEAALAQPHEVTIHLPSDTRERFSFLLEFLRMVEFLRRLPPLAPTHPPRAAGDDQARVHAKVRALLAKAESTTFEAEAEACTAKAQELMARYAIDEAALAAGAAPSGTASSMRVIVETPYARPKAILLSVVARNNRCRSVWHDDYGFSTVFGAGSDLWAVDVLYTSLLVQAGVALQREVERSRSFRHAFLLAFAYRIGERLREATRAATAAATVASGDAFLPVLAAREDAAEAARDLAYPHRSPLRSSMSSATGASAGRRAANSASLARDTAVPGRARRLGR